MRRLALALAFLASGSPLHSQDNGIVRPGPGSQSGGTGDVSRMSIRARLGLVGRTFADRASDVARAAAFGAVCDNASHPLSTKYATLAAARADYPAASALSDEIDWAAAQTAVDTRAALGGGTVEMPAGQCLFNRPLVLPGIVHVVGQSIGSFIKPGTAMSALVSVTGGNSSVRGLYFQNVNSLAASGVSVNKPWDNLPVKIADNSFVHFNIAIPFQGDNGEISSNFFNSNATAVSFTRSLNTRISSNYMLGGNGIDFPVPPQGVAQVEGIQGYANTILPAVSGAFGIRVLSGLQIDFTDTMLDQIKDTHSVILDGSTAPVQNITFKGGWIATGNSSGKRAQFDAVHVTGVAKASFVGVTTAGATGYDYNIDTSSNVGIVDPKATSTAGPAAIRLANAPQVAITGGVLANATASTVESGTTSARVMGTTFSAAPHPVSASRYFGNIGDAQAELQLSGSRGPDYITVDGGSGSAAVSATGASGSAYLILQSKGGAPILMSVGGTKWAVNPSNVTASVPVILASYTVAGLPTCNTALRDSLAVATDATAPTYRGVLTGGGTVRTPVYCDGMRWTAH